jgi:hypothetical protein
MKSSGRRGVLRGRGGNLSSRNSKAFLKILTATRKLVLMAQHTVSPYLLMVTTCSVNVKVTSSQSIVVVT